MKMDPLELALQAILFAPITDERATVLDSIQYYRDRDDERTVAIISWLIEASPRHNLGRMRLNDFAHNLPRLFPLSK